MVTAELFKALGDPTRLEIVQRLSSGTPYTITTVLRGMDVTRQGGRKHLQILVASKIVKLKPEGRTTIVMLDQKKLSQAKEFIAKLERQWDSRLENLRRFVDTE